LDELTRVCSMHGAKGSRMTGAGWGGCVVSLVPSDSVMSLLTAVRDNYYKLAPKKFERVKEALFATTPGDGAAFYIWIKAL